MKNTGNLGLKKPEGTDLVDIDDLNYNADILDLAVTGKVDKVTGKQLSTNDYTAAEKTKLAGIATGATNYTHPATHPPSIITQDASNRFVSDTEKTAWNAKASTAIATQTTPGLESAADKIKLDGIATGANNYTHPNHTGDVTSTGDGVTAIAAGVIVDADVNANAGIKFSKINAAGSIMDSDINDEAYINMLKIGTGKINNATLDQLYGVTSPIQDQLNARPKQTTGDITYYVRTDGNDNNTGLANTAGGAFKTINKAISMIPQILNHVVTINVASGSYPESVKISGKEGGAHVEFLGTSATIIGFSAERCKRIVVNGFTATSTIGAAFNVYDGGMIDIRNCIVIASAASQPGITISAQKADIRNCTISNRSIGIFSENGEVTSITNTGTGNVIGIYSSHSGSINKYGTQPNGTTPEAVLNGTITSGVLNPWGDNTTGMRTGVATGGGGSLQSIPANVFTKVNYSNEYFDYLDEWSNSKFTAKKNGLYAINTLLTFIGAADGTIAEVIVYKNGSKDQCIGRGGAVKFQDLSISGFTITDLNAGDTIELYVQQFGSAALNLTNDGSYTNLRITRVS